MSKLPKKVLSSKVKPYHKSPELLKLLATDADNVHSDILDRISNPVHKIIGIGIYSIDTIKNILKDPEDDTNETCRNLLEDLYEDMKKRKADGIIIFYNKEAR
jgi:hypothetical protein